MNNSTVQSWSEVWERPCITSFSVEFPNNYDGPMLDFWKKSLTGELDHVVDLACGNGALTWICNDLLNSGGRRTRISGVDYANIEPFKVLNRKEEDYPEIAFFANTDIDNLPFEDGSVDLVVSQYGVEYSDLDKSIPEIARVLGPTGKMSFILHDRDGDVIRGATRPLDAYIQLRDIFRLDESILKLAGLQNKNQSALAIRNSEKYKDLMIEIEKLNQAIQFIINKYPQVTPISAYKTMLDQALREAAKKPTKRITDVNAEVARARRALCGSIERLEDLAGAALSKKQRKHLIALIEKEGFRITEKRILEQTTNQNWGTVLVAQRAAAGPGPLGFLRRKIFPSFNN